MSEFWILVTILVVGFILTWIICHSPVSESDWKDLESKPGAFIPCYDYEKMILQREISMLQSKLRYAERENDELRFRLYGGWDKEALRKLLERPVEVNVDIENIIKVNSEKNN